MSDLILIHLDDAITTVVLNRPDRLNAMRKSMWRRLSAVLAYPEIAGLLALVGPLDDGYACYGAEDFQAGYRSFLEMGPPVFKGA